MYQKMESQSRHFASRSPAFFKEIDILIHSMEKHCSYAFFQVSVLG